MELSGGKRRKCARGATTNHQIQTEKAKPLNTLVVEKATRIKK